MIYGTWIVVLLQKTLDPPDANVVEDALSLLVNMQALKRSPRGRYEPTYYGSLLASFSLSFDSSVLILKFGDIGMLHEGILLGILMDTQPLPVLRPFGENNLVFFYYCYLDIPVKKIVICMPPFNICRLFNQL